MMTRRHHRRQRTVHIDPSSHYMERNGQLRGDPSTTPPSLHAGVGISGGYRTV